MKVDKAKGNPEKGGQLQGKPIETPDGFLIGFFIPFTDIIKLLGR